MALMVISTVGFAQKNKVQIPEMPLDEDSGLITYADKAAVDGATASDLYDRAYNWGKGHYKNYAEKLRVQDKENGRMEIFGRFSIYAHDKKGAVTTSKIGLIQYTLGIDLKEGRYRYNLSKINQKAASYTAIEQWLDGSDDNASNNAYKLIDIDNHIQELLSALNKAVKTAPKAAEDDW
jgi:hypothetical protein